MEPSLITALLLPFAFAPLYFFKRLKRKGLVFALEALLTLGLILIAGALSGWNHPEIFSLPYTKSLSFTFITDGLSLFFGLLITSVGSLIGLFAEFYMHEKESSLGRFYFWLSVFMGAMLGTVFSTNLLSLFLFWELTGIASYRLIGFHQTSHSAVDNSKEVLLTTAFTALFLFTGILLLGHLYGSYEWTEIVKNPSLFKESANAPLILTLFFVGVLGKSAQFPFYFWLPRAMVAPTPVSAYLHAATMVKLGIFLIARMYPLFVMLPLWFPLCTSFAYLTMLLGALLALVAHDLKALLAYATISQLGFFIGFYGIGEEEGVAFDFVHILNHTLYKGALFMLVGIIQEATGIRDIRRLGGLYKHLPLTAAIFLIAAASMAGLPGTIGFLSKELILTDIVLLGKAHHSGWIILGLLFSAMTFKVAFSMRLFVHLFLRGEVEPLKQLQRPSLAIQVAPAILALSAFFLGLFPTSLNHLTELFYVSGLHLENPAVIKLWHGWSVELGLSALIFLLGGMLFWLAEHSKWYKHDIPPLLKLDWLYEKALYLVKNGSVSLTESIHPKKVEPQIALLLLIAFLPPILLLSPLSYRFYPVEISYYLAGFFLVVASFLILFLKRSLSKLIALSASGFLFTLLLTLNRAPDLAMTQLLIEVATLILMLFYFIQREQKQPHFQPKSFLLAVFTAASFFLLTVYTERGPEEKPLKDYFLENSLTLAKGLNSVNTIVIDFRGFDTLGEISVVFIAVLGILALLKPQKSLSPQPAIPSEILSFFAKPISLIALAFSVYLLIKGHNSPGGGFIGGVTLALSMLILVYAGLYKPTLKPLLYLLFIGLGLVLSVAFFPLLFGNALLTHSSFSPLLFDLGIYLIVGAALLLILASFQQKAMEVNK